MKCMVSRSSLQITVYQKFFRISQLADDANFFFLVSKFGNLTFCSVGGGGGVRSPFLSRSWEFFFFFFFL